jgi:D-sedoheptulose 7-phosphate isomerase
MEELVYGIISDSIAVHQKIPVQDVVRAYQTIYDCVTGGGKVLICGNGGSAADSQHFAAELVNRFQVERDPIACIALTTDCSIITSVSNDYSFDDVFAKQVQALGRSGDVLIGISTSGNSANIVKAMNTAREREMRTIGLLGKDGGKLKDESDIAVVVPSPSTARIQESHILILHIICDLLDRTWKTHSKK